MTGRRGGGVGVVRKKNQSQIVNQIQITDIRVTNYFPNKAQKRVKVIRETRPNLNKNAIFFNARTLRFKLVFNL